MKKIILIVLAIILTGGCSTNTDYGSYNECDEYCSSSEDEDVLYQEFNKYKDTKCFFYNDEYKKYYLDDSCLNSLGIPHSFIEEVSYDDLDNYSILDGDLFEDTQYYSVRIKGSVSNCTLEYQYDDWTTPINTCELKKGNCNKEELLLISVLINHWEPFFPFSISYQGNNN